jgi:beta-glucosidase/6-phospho-beta-glucosidase/beta-galactosidase
MEITFSAEYQKRTQLCLDETKKHLSKALQYSEDLRDESRINFCKAHIIKLENLIKQPIGSKVLLSFN